MFRNLSPGAVGIGVSAAEAVSLARAAGFGGVDLLGGLAPGELRRLCAEHGLQVGAMGLPVEFRADQARYEQGMAGLRAAAKAAAEAGCSRCATWLRPCSDELPYLDNFRLHVQRLRPAAHVLGEFGIRLGLEYVAPKTSRDGKRHEFVHSLPQLLELCGAIGTGNVGLLLDSWHWYTARETVDDLRRLDNRLVVQVHVNDAPAGVPVDEQKDHIRDLPGATGVIDIAGFLKCLAGMGYDGPVTPEPFRPDLGKLPPAEAARVVGAAMDRIWKAAGLAG
jgi:sugar phosphate isomerase/epimerase